MSLARRLISDEDGQAPAGGTFAIMFLIIAAVLVICIVAGAFGGAS